MFVVIRRYATEARAEEVARRVGEGLLPILRDLPGYRAYYAFVAEDGRPVSVSLTQDRAAALAANERARAWMAGNMSDLLPDPPEVIMGEILVDGATFGQGAAAEQDRAADEEAADGGV